MITIWHNTTNSYLGKFYEIGLIPIAIVATDSLQEAFNFDLNQLKFETLDHYNPQKSYLTDDHVTRNTQTNDVLFQDGQCFLVDSSSCFVPLNQSLPHVGISIFPDFGDPIEEFPTLQIIKELDQQYQSVPIKQVNLTEYGHGWYYLETRQWSSNISHQLLRTYK